MLPSKDSYLIAKMFYHISNALKYSQLIKDNGNCSPHAKNTLIQADRRLSWCINDVRTNMTPQGAEQMRAQLDTWETLAFDAVFDEMILMSEAKRSFFEQVAKAYRKDELVLIQEPETV